jgi:hypothetical protein
MRVIGDVIEARPAIPVTAQKVNSLRELQIQRVLGWQP